jgi:autotransporter-associated beta strand protein
VLEGCQGTCGAFAATWVSLTISVIPPKFADGKWATARHSHDTGGPFSWWITPQQALACFGTAFAKLGGQVRTRSAPSIAANHPGDIVMKTARLLPALATLLLAVSASAEPVIDPGPIDAIFQQVIASDPGVQGISALIGYQGQIAYEGYFGGHTQGQVLDLASATKLMSGVTMLTLWDDGAYDLDAPVSSYLPSFAALPTSNAKRDMTMRQLFSHTAGTPNDASRIRQFTPTDFANRVANGTGIDAINLIGPPGDQYLYGNVGMQTAGGIAEILTGQSWDNIFAANVAGPLGMSSTNYGAGANPVMAGSGKATITNYGNMLEMILNNGSYNGQQVLSSAAIDELLTPNTVGIPFLNNPPRFPGGQYGFGLWLDIFDDEMNPILLASPGSSGFSPFIDLENEFWAIVMYDGGQSHATETLAIYDHILSEIHAIPEPVVVFNITTGTQTQSDAGYAVLTPEIATSVTKSGPGTLILDAANTFSSSLNVNEGTVVAANVQAIGTATLEVAAGATFAVSPLIGAANPVQLSALGDISGTIELDAGRFSLPAADESPEAQLRDLLISGRNGGGWNGTAGIVSSEAAGSAGTRAIGYAVANDGSAVVSFAAPGDTNLNGQVDVFDLVSVNSSGKYGSGQSAVWSQGDFNYDGVTNVFDLVGINTAGAYGQGNYLPSTLAVTVVPEPSTYAMALAGLACGGYLVRRRRKRA